MLETACWVLYGLCELGCWIGFALAEKPKRPPVPRPDRGFFFKDRPASWVISGIAVTLALIFYFSWLGRLFER